MTRDRVSMKMMLEKFVTRSEKGEEEEEEEEGREIHNRS